MKRLFFAMLLVSSVARADDQLPPSYGMIEGSSVSSIGVFSTNADLAGYDLENLDDIYSDPAATDVATRATVISTQGPYRGINATADDGANLYLLPESGANDLTGVTKANTAGDTVTFAGTLMTGAAYSVTLTEAVDYACVLAASDAACVVNLAAAVEAHATLGGYVDTATVVGETAAWWPTPGVAATLTVTASDAVNTVISRGTDGVVVVPDGSAAAPGLRTTSYAHGLHSAGAGALGFSAAGTLVGSATSNGFVVPAVMSYAWTGRSKLTSPADGNLILANAAGTQGVKFDTATTDGVLTLTDESGAASWLNTARYEIGAATSYLGTAGLLYAGAFYVKSNDRSVTTATGAVSLYSGAQTNAGDYASGKVSVYTGATTTDGDSGDVEIYTGAAGAGAADAGDIVMAVNGAPGVGTTALRILGSTGTVNLALIAQKDVGATCTTGEWALDTAGTAELCYCQAANTWYCIAFTDTTGPAD